MCNRVLFFLVFLLLFAFPSSAFSLSPDLSNLEPDAKIKSARSKLCPVKTLPALKAKQDSGASEVITPVNGTTLSDSSQDFTWSAGSGQQMWWIHAGSSLGGMDYYNEVQWATYGTVSGLPTDGSTIYVRLFTYFGDSGWQYNDYQYKAASQAVSKAELTLPEDGSTLSGSSEQFTWTVGGGDGLFQISIGSTPGGIEYFNQPLWDTSVTATNLPTDGSTVYARLWTHFPTGWLFNDYTFTASDQGGTKYPAVMLSPEDGSTLGGSQVTITFEKGNGDGLYQVSVGSTQGGIDYYNQPVWDTDPSATEMGVEVTSLPTDGSDVCIRVWTHYPSGWEFNDYAVTAYEGSQDDPTLAVLIDPADESSIKGDSADFTFTKGDGDGLYWISMGTEPAGTEYCNQAIWDDVSEEETMGVSLDPASGMTLPQDGSEVYCSLYTHYDSGYQRNDYTLISLDASGGDSGGDDPIQILAELTTPADGTILSSAHQKFEWTQGIGGLEYKLSVGTTEGGTDLYDSTQWKNTYIWVNDLPGDGSTVYITLGTRFPSGWQYNKYAFYTDTNYGSKTLLYPSEDETLLDDTVNLVWDDRVNVGYNTHLKVGTTEGGSDLVDTVSSYGRKYDVQVPTDGSDIYVSIGTEGTDGQTRYLNTKFKAAPKPRDRAILWYTDQDRAFRTEGDTIEVDPREGYDFRWKIVSDAEEYVLQLGSRPGYGEYYYWRYPATMADDGMISDDVNDIPLDKEKIYASLYTKFKNGTDLCQNYVFNVEGKRDAACPLVVSPEPGSVLTDGLLTFKWVGQEGAVRYHYEFKRNFSGETVANGTTTRPQVTFDWSPNGETHIFYLRAEDSSGDTTVAGAWVYGSTGSEKDKYPTVPYVMYFKTVPLLFEEKDTLDGAEQTLEFRTFVRSTGEDSSINIVNYGKDQEYCVTARKYKDSLLNTYFSGCFPYTQTSVKMTNLPTDGTPVWLVFKGEDLSEGTDRNLYVKVNARLILSYAKMSSPSAGNAFSGTSQKFSWTSGNEALSYTLDVGTSLGGTDIAHEEGLLELSHTVTGLPEDGSTVYVRLTTILDSGETVSKDYQYTAYKDYGELISPVADEYVFFQDEVKWRRAEGTTYKVTVSLLGGQVLWEKDCGTKTSAIWSLDDSYGENRCYVNLERTGADGIKSVEKRLVYLHEDDVHITSPKLGSVLSSEGGKFIFSSHDKNPKATMNIGTAKGGNDLANGLEVEGTTFSEGWDYTRLLTLLKDHQKIWVRLADFYNSNDYEDIYFYGPKK